MIFGLLNILYIVLCYKKIVNYLELFSNLHLPIFQTPGNSIPENTSCDNLMHIHRDILSIIHKHWTHYIQGHLKWNRCTHQQNLSSPSMKHSHSVRLCFSEWRLFCKVQQYLAYWKSFQQISMTLEWRSQAKRQTGQHNHVQNNPIPLKYIYRYLGFL